MLLIFILCFIQSVTEFIPVSSTAHIIVAEKLMNIDLNNPVLHVGFHFGTFLAVIIFYFKDIFFLVTHFIRGALVINQRESIYFWLGLKLFCATLPAIIVGYFLKPILVFLHGNLHIIAISSILLGSLMAFVDCYQNEDEEELTFKTAMFMGFAQLLAFFPGGSRLGTTVSAARIMGVSRFQAFRYSMLLSLPIVFGALVLSFKDAYSSCYSFFDEKFLIISFLTFSMGILTLWFVQKFIAKIGFTVFGLYRVFFGLFLLGLIFIGIIL